MQWLKTYAQLKEERLASNRCLRCGKPLTEASEVANCIRCKRYARDAMAKALPFMIEDMCDSDD